MNPVKQKILNQLIYSEIFGYPLTKKEIAFAIGIEDIEIELSYLVEQNLVLQEEEYYTVFEGGRDVAQKAGLHMRKGRGRLSLVFDGIKNRKLPMPSFLTIFHKIFRAIDLFPTSKLLRYNGET